jgi:hypothetical protein
MIKYTVEGVVKNTGEVISLRISVSPKEDISDAIEKFLQEMAKRGLKRGDFSDVSAI